MTHYLFSLVGDGDDEAVLRARAADWLRARRWVVNHEERHRDALAVGDLALIYLGAPVQAFVGHAELASAVRGPAGEVLLTNVEEWDPPVPIADVLAEIDTSEGAREASRPVFYASPRPSTVRHSRWPKRRRRRVRETSEASALPLPTIPRSAHLMPAICSGPAACARLRERSAPPWTSGTTGRRSRSARRGWERLISELLSNLARMRGHRRHRRSGCG